MATAGPNTAGEGTLDGEVDMNYPQIIKQQLRISLSGIASAGSFATYNPCLNAPNPGLFVKGIGFISLPLSEQNAGSIIQASLSRLGKDSAIVSARTIKELDSEQFELRSPAWPQTLQDIIDQIPPHATAGVSAVKAEPYKLLIYQRGAESKPHEQYVVGQSRTRSCREPLVFGTLEICLPSKHEGGFLQITKAGETGTLNSATNSGSGYSFMAWYAKVTHEVTRVTSGYRFSLIYNLIYTPSGAPLFTAVPDGEEDDLRRAFDLWRESLSRNEKASPNKLIYVLDRNYSNEGLGARALVGNDRVKALCLQKACMGADFFLYLSNLERTVRGNCDEDGFGGLAYFVDDLGSSHEDDSGKTYHEITGIQTKTDELKYIVGPYGPETSASILIGEHDIIQPEEFANGPDKEEYSVATQDGGATAIHYYHRTVVVLMPRSHCIDFLFEIVKDGRLDVIPWIKSLMQDTERSPNDSPRKDGLIRLCQLIIEVNKAFLEKNHPGQHNKSKRESKNSQYSGDAIGRVVGASLMLRRLDLFGEALAVATEELSPWVYANIGKAIHSIGFAEIKDSLDKAAPSLTRVYQRYNALDDILIGYEAVAELQDGRGDDLADLEEWVKGKIEESLDDRLVFMKDGLALVRMTGRYGNEFLFERVLPFVKAHASNAKFTMAFLTNLFGASNKGAVARNVVTSVFRDILSDLIPALTLRCDSEATTKRQRTDAECKSRIDDGPEPTQYPEQPFVPSIDSQSIARLLDHCISLNLDQENLQVLQKLTSESQNAHPSIFHSILLPFLTHLLTIILPANKIPPTDFRYRLFTQELISTYIARYIRPEPENRVPPLGCRECRDCEKLDRFLVDPKFNTIRFSMVQCRREHVEHHTQESRELRVETVRASLPHSLVVKKVAGEAAVKWRKRCEEAEKWMQELGSETQVKEMLGSGYKAIVGLNAVRAPVTEVEPGRKIQYS
ncbi:MAG: hypothetical protein M1840_009033 [Geoglossum simile]|nr:MAG: hypothetical protein M1840_009033 [Geoglossum simile]